jgi:hypothetical protein
MRFTRHARTLGRSKTPSAARLGAARRALKRERDRAPLFAAEIAAVQPTAEERITAIDAAAAAWLANRRHELAASWRASRHELRSMPGPEALAILHEWQYGHLPGSPEYLANLIHARRNGTPIDPLIAAQVAAWLRGAPGGHNAGRRVFSLFHVPF